MLKQEHNCSSFGIYLLFHARFEITFHEWSSHSRQGPEVAHRILGELLYRRRSCFQTLPCEVGRTRMASRYPLKSFGRILLIEKEREGHKTSHSVLHRQQPKASSSYFRGAKIVISTTRSGRTGKTNSARL